MSNNFREFFNHYEVNSTSNDVRRYCLLWKSVIAQAIADAVNTGQKTENFVTKHKALSWLSGDSRDFVYTCILANCDPQTVKNKIRPILEHLNRGSNTSKLIYDEKFLAEVQKEAVEYLSKLLSKPIYDKKAPKEKELSTSRMYLRGTEKQNYNRKLRLKRDLPKFEKSLVYLINVFINP